MAPGLVLAAVLSAAVPAVPGGVARISLGDSAQAPRTSLAGNRVLVMREADGWVAVVGIPLSTKPGAKLRVEVQYADKQRRLEIAVTRKKYPQQKLSMAPEQAELPPEQLARYEEERKHIQEVLRTFSETAPASLAMQQPVPGRRSGSFGLRRVINGVARNPHSGMDIAAASGLFCQPHGTLIGFSARITKETFFEFAGSDFCEFFSKLSDRRGLINIRTAVNKFIHLSFGDSCSGESCPPTYSKTR